MHIFSRWDIDEVAPPMVYCLFPLNHLCHNQWIMCLLLHTLIEGDSKGFTDTYLEAINMQCKAQRSVGSDAADIFLQPLPLEIYIHIFSYLSPRDVCRAMRVCKVHV